MNSINHDPWLHCHAVLLIIIRKWWVFSFSFSFFFLLFFNHFHFHSSFVLLCSAPLCCIVLCSSFFYLGQTFSSSFQYINHWMSITFMEQFCLFCSFKMLSMRQFTSHYIGAKITRTLIRTEVNENRKYSFFSIITFDLFFSSSFFVFIWTFSQLSTK